VDDRLPLRLTFVNSTPSQGIYSPITGRRAVGTLANGATATLVITAEVSWAGGGTNTAAATSDTFDPNLVNNSDSVSYTPQQADLAVTKTVDNSTPTVGDAVTFTVTLHNNGPDDATGVTLHDRLPAGLAFVSATPARGTYDSTSGTWTVGTLADGATTTLVLRATVTDTTVATNVASVSASDVFDPKTINNVDRAVVFPQEADLHLAKTVNDPAPNVGDTVTFTLTLTSQGPNPATNATVTDLLPAGLTFVSAAPTRGTYNPATRVWAVGTLGDGATVRLTVTARVDSPAAMTNTGTATADQFDRDPGDNTADATVTPQRADLAVLKTVDNPAANVGDTITLTNLGPDRATNIVLHDPLPAGVTITSATAGTGTINVAARNWLEPSLASGGTATLVIKGRVTSPAPTPNVIDITGADQFDPNLANNVAQSVANPLSADLQLVKTVNNPAPNVGDTVTFTLTLTNGGPDPATGAVVSDLLPAGLTFVGATPGQGTYDPATGVWTVGTLAGGAAATLTIDARVSGPAPGPNVAVASSGTFDPDPVNNTGVANLIPQQADLGLTKVVSNPTPNVGDAVTFTITLTNGGPNDATNVTARDLLPMGLTFLTATPGQGTYDPVTGTWLVGTVPAGGSATLTIQARVAVVTPQANVVTVTHSDQFDPDPNNDRAVAVVSGRQSDLTVTKVASARQVTVGGLVTFTVTVRDLGPSLATGVFVTDKLPVGLAFISARPSQGAYTARTGQWAVGSLAPGGSATLRITARVVVAGTYRNTAVAGFGGPTPTCRTTRRQPWSPACRPRCRSGTCSPHPLDGQFGSAPSFAPARFFWLSASSAPTGPRAGGRAGRGRPERLRPDPPPGPPARRGGGPAWRASRGPRTRTPPGTPTKTTSASSRASSCRNWTRDSRPCRTTWPPTGCSTARWSW
jgi:large repetitive protein